MNNIFVVWLWGFTFRNREFFLFLFYWNLVWKFLFNSLWNSFDIVWYVRLYLAQTRYFFIDWLFWNLIGLCLLYRIIFVKIIVGSDAFLDIEFREGLRLFHLIFFFSNCFNRFKYINLFRLGCRHLLRFNHSENLVLILIQCNRISLNCCNGNCRFRLIYSLIHHYNLTLSILFFLFFWFYRFRLNLFFLLLNLSYLLFIFRCLSLNLWFNVWLLWNRFINIFLLDIFSLWLFIILFYRLFFLFGSLDLF